MEDLIEVIDRKKQFEDDVRVVRLTGNSKNTFRESAANSLSYSPSPKRGISASRKKSQPEIHESPIVAPAF